jgi:hypothetical protein
MKRYSANTLCVCFCLLAVALGAVSARAQGTVTKDDANVFTDIGRWFERSLTSIGDQFKGAGKGIDHGLDKLNRDATLAAKSTANAAADAADTVAKLPKTRMVSGRQACALAENGAPDCAAAADKLCQAKGMKSGTSLDVTSARECPLRKVTDLHKPRECKNVTFVSRAVCQ